MKFDISELDKLSKTANRPSKFRPTAKPRAKPTSRPAVPPAATVAAAAPPHSATATKPAAATPAAAAAEREPQQTAAPQSQPGAAAAQQQLHAASQPRAAVTAASNGQESEPQAPATQDPQAPALTAAAPAPALRSPQQQSAAAHTASATHQPAAAGATATAPQPSAPAAAGSSQHAQAAEPAGAAGGAAGASGPVVDALGLPTAAAPKRRRFAPAAARRAPTAAAAAAAVAPAGPEAGTSAPAAPEPAAQQQQQQPQPQATQLPSTPAAAGVDAAPLASMTQLMQTQEATLQHSQLAATQQQQPTRRAERATADVSRLPSNFINMMLQSMSLSDRFTCALVCKAWAQEATAATRSIILRSPSLVQDLSCLQRWLEKHGHQLEVLQLHTCQYYKVVAPVLTALPCPQLQHLLAGDLILDSRVWSDIAAATKLTSVCMERVGTQSHMADVMSALTALSDLEQLTWSRVRCGEQRGVFDSVLFHQLTKLTALTLDIDGAPAALEHLSLLTRLQDLTVTAHNWTSAGCPGLQELKALTRLELPSCFDVPSSISQLGALQQLDVSSASPSTLNTLHANTGLTHLCLENFSEQLYTSSPLQLPGLRHLEVADGDQLMPMFFLNCCTQLQVLKLGNFTFCGPGSLVASSMLQRLELCECGVCNADGDPDAWQQFFSGPGRLPHLTLLELIDPEPALQHADLEHVVACCSSLQVLHLDALPVGFLSTLTRLSGLTSLTLEHGYDEQCSSLAWLTGLRELRFGEASEVAAAGLRQLAALKHLTSLGLHSFAWGSLVLREHMSDKLPGMRHALVNKAPAGQPPDVSARLRRACDMAIAEDRRHLYWRELVHGSPYESEAEQVVGGPPWHPGL